MEQRISADELRRAAQFVEAEGLAALDDFGDIPFPLARGDLREFPRPAPQDQAAAQGFAVLRQTTEEAVAMLYALAAALDAGREVPAPLLAPVQGYIDAFRAAGERPAEADEQAVEAGAATPSRRKGHSGEEPTS